MTTPSTYSPTYAYAGDFIIGPGSDPSNGTGYLRAADYIQSLSTRNATSTSTGAFQAPSGGFSVGLDGYIGGKLTTLGASVLQQLDVTTTNGPFTVHGSGVINLSSSASPITFQTQGTQSINLLAGNGLNETVTAGDYVNTIMSGNFTNSTSGNVGFTLTGAGNFTVKTNKGQVSLTGTSGLANALLLTSGDPASGIMLTAGSTGITATSAGAMNFTANNAASSFTSNTTANQQDLTLQLTGQTASRIVTTSSGTGFDAIFQTASAGGIYQLATTKLTQTVTNGPFVVSGTGSNSSLVHNMTADGQSFALQLLSPTSTTGYNGQFLIQSNGNTTSAFSTSAPYGGYTSNNLLGHYFVSSSGPFRLISTGGPTPCRIASVVTSDSQDFSIALVDSTASKQSRLTLSSDCPPADAIRFSAANGGVSLNAKTVWTSTVSAGLFTLNATVPTTTTTGGCSITEFSSASGQDFTIALAGSGSGPGTSRLRLTSAGTGTDALNLIASAGGVTLSAAAQVSLDTTDVTNGIKIGTQNTNVPIFLGKAGNQVTCNSDITFTGNLTFATNSTIPVETQQMLVQDRSIVVNSTPAFAGDAAYLLGRYQSTPSGVSDDVVTDTPYSTGTAQSGTTTSIVLASGSNTQTGFYIGFYIKITAGTAKNFVTQITAYNGSTLTATTKDTFPTAPDNTSVYALYGNAFAGVVFRNTTKRFELLFCPTNYETSSTQVTASAWAPLYLQTLQTVPGTGAIYTDTISGSTGTAVNVSGVTANNSALTNVASINGDLPPIVQAVSLTVSNGASTTAALSFLTSTMMGSFILMINADQTTNPGGPTEIWVISKAAPTKVGTCSKISSSAGTSKNETLKVTWPASSMANVTYDLSLLNTNLPASGTYRFAMKLQRTLTTI